MRFVKPLDEELLHKILKRFKKIVTVEDGCIKGGFGSAVLEFMADKHYTDIQVVRLGIPDRFIEHGTQKELQLECGFDAKAIAEAVKKLINNRIPASV
jgi:1-deoxy-D-xylulose-5-phosphate synthase